MTRLASASLSTVITWSFAWSSSNSARSLAARSSNCRNRSRSRWQARSQAATASQMATSAYRFRVLHRTLGVAVVRVQSQTDQTVTQTVLLCGPAVSVHLHPFDRVERRGGRQDGDQLGVGWGGWRRSGNPAGHPPQPTRPLQIIIEAVCLVSRCGCADHWHHLAQVPDERHRRPHGFSWMSGPGQGEAGRSDFSRHHPLPILKERYAGPASVKESNPWYGLERWLVTTVRPWPTSVCKNSAAIPSWSTMSRATCASPPPSPSRPRRPIRPWAR